MATISLRALRSLLEASLAGPGSMTARIAEEAERLLHARHVAAYDWARPYVAGRDVLEIGVNRGYGSRLIAADSRSFMGVDLSLDHVRETRSRYGLRCLKADGQGLPFRAESFDTVVTFQVIEHVWDDVAYLEEINRVLRPGGLLLISTPQATGRLLPGQRPWNPEHLREYDEGAWRRRLRQAFNEVLVLGLFGDDIADRVERWRVHQDPWNHFFGGPWARPLRLVGRATRAGMRMVAGRRSAADLQDPHALQEDARSPFFLDVERLDRALDLLAVCWKGVTARGVRKFDGADYWRQRLGEAATLEVTGTLGGPLAWQEWLYRGKRRAYVRLLRRAGINIRGAQVLDLGCGTGYFEDMWERKGARRADGIDIVPGAISRLRAGHPGRRYLCVDLARDVSPLGGLGDYDLITAIDVLYHIVDDWALMRTLRALVEHLAGGGTFLLTDALRDHRPAAHVRFRSLNQWRQILTMLGLRVVDMEPVFALNNRLLPGLERAPGLYGAIQHLLDLPLLRTMPWLANNWATLAVRQ